MLPGSTVAEEETPSGTEHGEHEQNPTNTQGQKKTKRRNKHVHFSHSTVVRLIENQDTFEYKFRSFKRAILKRLPCLNIKISPYNEFTTATEFEEKKGDLAKVGMPVKKRGSIGEIDLTSLKSQLEKFQELNAKMLHFAESEEKFQAEELRHPSRF